MGTIIPAGRGIAATSEYAFANTDADKNTRLVLSTIAAYGSTGCISDQIQKSLKTMPYGSVTNHFRELINKGHIEVIGKRRGLSGRPQRVYTITPSGKTRVQEQHHHTGELQL